MRNWLHVYYIKNRKYQGQWAYSRAGAERPLLKSTSMPWIGKNAEYFAHKHKLLLFIHDQQGNVIEHRDYRKGWNVVSKDFKTHYNDTMGNKLGVEVPNLKESANVKELKVRAVFKDKEEPEYLNVFVFMHNGTKVKFKVGRYGFPDAQLLARIGLLV